MHPEHPPAEPRPSRRASRRWPMILTGLLLTHVALMLAAVSVAVSGVRGTVEPDYYRKAANWEQTLAARHASDRLGWTLDITAGAEAESDGSHQLALRLTDPAGQPVDGAQVTVIAFHLAAADHSPRTAEPQGAGIYRLRLPRSQPGAWELRTEAIAGTDRFLDRRRITLPGATP